MSKEIQEQTKKCKHCQSDIPKKAKVCPNCHKKQGGILKWIIIIIVVLIILVSLSNSNVNNDTENNPASSGSSKIEETVGSSAEVIEASVSEPSSEATKTDNIPAEYKSALNKAITYSDAMHMSKAAIYDQLTSEYGEKFSAEAAQYAIDNVEVDWKVNALKKAEEYSDTMYMSKAGIYDQLISEYGEKFTEEEAQYAIDNVEADWKSNALEKAKTYQSTMSMSPEAIRDQLMSEYGEQFTKEEADYAIENLNK